MIIKAKQYASALYEIGKKRGILKEFLDGLTLAKDGLVKQKFNIPQNIDNYLANFFNLLFENKDLLKLKNIYYEFEKIYNNENNIANVEITLACKPQKEEKEILENIK
ncbi:MAG: F0F1 ATP synthase subunit delta, partial [Patescibacteria group bacterium]|nr:F0F1 ATP synthase subunit delta [Patescibacteria group bacterium]